MGCRIGRYRNVLFLAGLVLTLFCSPLLSGCEKTQQGDGEAGEESAEEQVMQMGFYDLFEINGDMVTPKVIIRYGSTTMTPEVPFEVGVMRFGDTPFTDFIGRDAEVRKEGMIYRIIRFH